jgi:acetylornithine/succinyldiaminopimelate/putrescine aminotransferase
MTARDLLAEYAALTSPGHVAALRAAGHDLVEGERGGCYVSDTAGKRYVDCIGSAGIYNLGRRHPELLAELGRAARETDQGNFPMISAEKAALGRRLAEFVPGPLDCAVFSVMRGEAMEFACKLARGATGRPGLVAVDGGWHGETGFALSLSQRPDKDRFGPLVPGVVVVAHGDLEAARRAVGDDTAAVVLEPIQAENHCREVDRDYLHGLRELCRARGAVLVYDETQTGLGRTGEKFAFEHFGAGPDVLILGEALGGGVFPIAATVFTQRLNQFMNRHPLIHLSTFGGSDIGCRVAVKALDIYQRDQPWRNAAAIGDRLRARFAAQVGATPLRSVAGRGLLLSLALDTPAQALALCRRAAAHGVLVAPGRVATHAVVLRPSLLLDDAAAAALHDGVAAALGELA